MHYNVALLVSYSLRRTHPGHYSFFGADTENFNIAIEKPNPKYVHRYATK